MLLGALALSDSGGSSSSGLSTTPEANSAYDNSHQGIYKGSIVGSSGTWKLDVDNKGTGAAPVFSYTYTPTGSSTTYSDNVTGSLSGTGPYTLDFSSTVPGLGVSFTVQIVLSAVGNINSATLTVAGTGVDIRGYKEKSDALIRVFEGTFSGTTLASQSVSGVWNMTITGITNIQSRSKTLKVAGADCTTECDTSFPSAALEAGTLKISSQVTAACGSPQACTCTTTVTSNEGFSIGLMSGTGSWTTKITTNVGGNCYGSAMAVGTTIVSGTLTGTRTR